ncbi:lysoplasmalogenase [Vibrio ostreicida]|uniref:Lysoplasmalogenase family protein n=1 Tax=Vibrio ostreicida TaxID=526588 RepID=A0ABT8BQR3_9VIBR|nr:lysoplasmalogenase family protein [Vibrio ostreicida]MDN3608781.1 lysoplasmalogenase family protein [Vibrio ostreicida]NPD10785.1 lysoplasmalogenase [Vibrio ostreicida]
MWSWISVALSGFISISANQNSEYHRAAVFKTLSLAMLVALIWDHTGFIGASVRWVTLGLLVSMLADGLYVQKRGKKLCFAAFIGAQLCFSASFWVQLSGEIVWWLPAMLLAIGVVIFFLMLPKIDRLVFPVVIMGMVLLQLNWAAGEVWLLTQTVSSLLGAFGSFILLVSAILLAVHDYKHSIFGGRYVISGSYLLAYSLITASLFI